MDEAMLRCWAVVPAAEKSNALVAMDATVEVCIAEITVIDPCITMYNDYYCSLRVGMHLLCLNLF